VCRGPNQRRPRPISQNAGRFPKESHLATLKACYEWSALGPVVSTKEMVSFESPRDVMYA